MGFDYYQHCRCTSSSNSLRVMTYPIHTSNPILLFCNFKCFIIGATTFISYDIFVLIFTLRSKNLCFERKGLSGHNRGSPSRGRRSLQRELSQDFCLKFHHPTKKRICHYKNGIEVFINSKSGRDSFTLPAPGKELHCSIQVFPHYTFVHPILLHKLLGSVTWV